jgi:simple sugar transport system substrate-binding protein
LTNYPRELKIKLMPEEITPQTNIPEQPKTARVSSKLLLSIAVFAALICLLGIGGYFLILTQNNSNSSKNNSAVAPESTKICSGVKIVFFSGGNESDSFARTVYNGARAAEMALGPSINYLWSDWNSVTIVAQFQDAIGQSPDAIAVMGHPGADALSPLVDQAEKKGIIVTLQNVDIPTIREKYTSNGFGYVGQELVSSGKTLAEGTIRKYDLKAGTEALVIGGGFVNGQPTPRTDRAFAVRDAFKAAGLKVDFEPQGGDINTNAESDSSIAETVTLIKKYPNIKVVVFDGGSMTAAAPIYLSQAGIKAGGLIVAGFDLSAETVKGIKDGYVSLVSDQQPYLQGFLPILQACLTKKYGFAGLYVNTGIGLIDNSNVDQIASLAKQGIR